MGVHPSVNAIEALQTMVNFQRLTECETLEPLGHHRVLIVRVYEFQAVKTSHIVNSRTRIVEKAFIGGFLLAR